MTERMTDDGGGNVILSDFVARYPPRPPQRPHNNDDELRQLGPGDGVLFLTGTPAVGPMGPPDDDQTRHLWVFREDLDLPYLLELVPIVAPRLKSVRAHHTNLTAGRPASCGGELWIDVTSNGRLYVNGWSGRYGPTSREQLEDAILVFRALGFDVISYGWDDETQKPRGLYVQ